MAEDSQCLAVTQKLSELQKLLSPCTVNQQHPTTIDKKNSSALVKYLHANALFYLHGSLCIKSEVLTKSSSSFIFKTRDMSKSIQIKAAQPGRKLHLQLPWEYTLTRVLNTIVTKQNIQNVIIYRQFLTRRNTTEVITRVRINAKADDLSHRNHTVSRHILVRSCQW